MYVVSGVCGGGVWCHGEVNCGVKWCQVAVCVYVWWLGGVVWCQGVCCACVMSEGRCAYGVVGRL